MKFLKRKLTIEADPTPNAPNRVAVSIKSPITLGTSTSYCDANHFNSEDLEVLIKLRKKE